jgi:alpha-ribazole phosphatase
MKTYNIHLIRHGKLEEKYTGKYVGKKTDAPVSNAGMQELHLMREKLWYPEADVVFTSPLMRCIQTAHALYPEQDYMIVDELSECDFGIFEGRGYEELKKDAEFIKWAQGGMKDAMPEGESGLEFAQRCYEGFSKVAEYIMKTGIKDAAIITHGGVITSILSSLAFPKREFYEWNAQNGCGCTVTTTPQLWMSGSVVELYSNIPLKHAEED